MLLQPVTGLVLVALLNPAIAAPLDVIAMGSKHNVYLVTCTRTNALDCPLPPLICATQTAAAKSYSAVAYYPNGPITSSKSTPNQIVTVSEPPQPWEGTTHTVKLTIVGDFAANIDAGANTLPQGQLAGTAKLADEDFVCFTDGVTKFSFDKSLGIEKHSCTADYWCPSIAV
ncbi:hypothetical protein CC78DRAFT_533598 [Lojkania enalia]|uniref:Phosphatidylglycerol/phosphatidylinositol transfer protein n=1 Tax=Lojkania enalia TaxID=147567 RepID=A0A9P4N5Z2_9PLEO|nr:hypothetical protein CC78DRAFT_533598 [Didymosphaeria enalia]